MSTTTGDLELRIPKQRTGSVLPSLLERRRRVDQARRVVSQAVVIATGVRADGWREALGFADRTDPGLGVGVCRVHFLRNVLAQVPATPPTCSPSPAPARALEQDLVDQPAGTGEKETNRRTDFVGVFLNPEVLLRLAGAVLVEAHAVLVEAHDEWQTTDRRYPTKPPWPC